MSNRTDYKQMGYRIRMEREKLGLARDKFAEMIEISSQYLGQIERGERKLSLDALIRITDRLHLSTDYIIYGKDSCDERGLELCMLIKRCSEKEIEVIDNVIRAILPNLKK